MQTLKKQRSGTDCTAPLSRWKGHKLELPENWGEEDVRTNGMPRVMNATREIFHTSRSVIDFDEKGIKERKRSGQEIRQTLEAIVAHSSKNGDELPRESLVEVTAVSTRIYCLKTLWSKEELGLRCNAVDGTIVIKSAGPPDTEGQVLAILSSFD